MTGRATLLPVAMVAIIAVLALIAIVSGRSNAPTLVGDARYPHHICTFNEYCLGGTCSREWGEFIIYFAHETGRPRLEIPGVAPTAVMSESNNVKRIESTGGAIDATVSLYSDRNFDYYGTSGDGDALVEHFATGKCERLRTP